MRKRGLLRRFERSRTRHLLPEPNRGRRPSMSLVPRLRLIRLPSMTRAPRPRRSRRSLSRKRNSSDEVAQSRVSFSTMDETWDGRSLFDRLDAVGSVEQCLAERTETDAFEEERVALANDRMRRIVDGFGDREPGGR